MLKFTFAMLALFAGSVSAMAEECHMADAYGLHLQILPEDADKSFPSKITERVDGATWDIYFGKDKKPQRIVHTDYGEAGRDERKLTVSDGRSYIITVHNYEYSATRDYIDSNTIRETIDRYVFCNAKLELPEGWELDKSDMEYVDAARKAAAFFFASDEIAEQIKQAGLTPPTW
jgi:hypothetical protein